MESYQLTNYFPDRKRVNQNQRRIKVEEFAKPNTAKNEGDSHSKSKTDLDILKAFDLTLEYGPCIGITRMERWERAEKHSMNPPPNVKEIIKRHENDEVFKQSLWSTYSTLN